MNGQAKLGFTYYVGPEVEHWYFKNSTGTEPIDHEGYFGQDATGLSTELRRETVLMLEELGIPRLVQPSRSYAPSQHEIDLRHTDALPMADTLMTYRLVVKEIAMKHGCYATFMPKPVDGINGSGMHTHQSLFKGNRNEFFNGEERYQTVERRQMLYCRADAPRKGDYPGDQPVGELVQATCSKI